MEPNEPTKRPRGRPPKPPEEVLVLRSIRLPVAAWDKIDAAGMDALRALLKRWKPPLK
jgi:hypothetical protein